jgi:digeranylgeranylglycerophospholipid reductase
MRGLKTICLDKRKEIGVPVQCGEFMASNEEVEALFPKAGEVTSLFDLPESLIEARTSVIRIYSPSLKAYDVPFEGYTVCRDRVDKHWARLAEKEGAEILTDCLVQRVNGIDVLTSRGPLKGRVVVAADGPYSMVARSVGLSPPTELAAAITCEVEGNFGDALEIYFGSIAPGGYAWVIPKNGTANVGLGVWHRYNGNLARLLNGFLDRKGFRTDGWTGGWVPEMGPVPKTVKDNVLLVGDAAGHVMPTNGGGVNLAMVCARIAAHAIADHLQNGSFLEEYEWRWRQVAGEQLETGVKIKKLADQFFLSDFWMGVAMRILGRKRMERAIRCQSIWPTLRRNGQRSRSYCPPMATGP